MRRVLAAALLLALSGCGTFLDPRCLGGTAVEKPCFCSASNYHGQCPPGGGAR